MTLKKKIYYHDTDCGGVVYYANYLKYLEEARTEFFAEKGISIKELADSGTMFVVARQEIDYKFPGRYADVLELNSSIGLTSGVRIEFLCVIKNQDGKIIANAKTVLVCVGTDLRPKQIPEELVKKFTPLHPESPAF